jgi:hypothetical protein
MSGRDEDGYALVTAVMIAMVLSLLLLVVVAQAVHTNTVTAVAVRRNQALSVAESGVNWAIASLEADRAGPLPTNQEVPVPGAAQSGRTADQVSDGKAWVTVTAGTPASPGLAGYFTVSSTGQVGSSPTRTIRVVLAPGRSFTSVLYATGGLTIGNNACIVGTVASEGNITFEGNAKIAGTSSVPGSIYSTGDSIDFHGANNPKCPDYVNGEPVDARLDVHGDVLLDWADPTRCRTAPAEQVDNDYGDNLKLNGATVGGRLCDRPPLIGMPEYTFDPELYGRDRVRYYGHPPGIEDGYASGTAVEEFNAALAGATLDRPYVVWQDLTESAARGDKPPALRFAGTVPVSGDTVIYTNVPVEFANNTTIIGPSGSCSTADPTPPGASACPSFQIISTYPGTPCPGGNCPSIDGGNGVEFQKVAVLLYSRDGSISLVNDCNGPACAESNQGAFYAKSVNAKNNLNVSYSPRVARAIGFGQTALEQQTWQELVPCPPRQASC